MKRSGHSALTVTVEDLDGLDDALTADAVPVAVAQGQLRRGRDHPSPNRCLQRVPFGFGASRPPETRSRDESTCVESNT